MTRHLATDDERKANRIASYAKYNETHRAERRAHNREYSKLAHVKARRRELYRLSKFVSAPAEDAAHPPAPLSSDAT